LISFLVKKSPYLTIRAFFCLASDRLIVPTLRVETPPRTLRVPVLAQRSEICAVVTQSVTGCIPTQSMGTINKLTIRAFFAWDALI
jgi:hypothetical protein